MKLYFDQFSCSMSPHIVLREAGLDYELEWVDLRSLTTATGADFSKINPKGYVPVLQLDDDTILTEGAPMVQFIADLAPEAELLGPVGSVERYRAAEWLTFTSSELHRGFTPLFSSDLPDFMKERTLKRLHRHFDFLSNQLSDRDYLLGDRFCIADAYCFTILNWENFVDVDLSSWPVLRDYAKRVKSRPKVQEVIAMEEEAKPKK